MNDTNNLQYAINEIQNRIKPHDLEGVASLETIKEYVEKYKYTQQDIDEEKEKAFKQGADYFRRLALEYPEIRETAFNERKQRVYLALDKDGRTGGYQVSIGSEDSQGHGIGYRLAGPKYNGSSVNILKQELDKEKAKLLLCIVEKHDNDPGAWKAIVRVKQYTLLGENGFHVWFMRDYESGKVMGDVFIGDISKSLSDDIKVLVSAELKKRDIDGIKQYCNIVLQ